MVGKLDESGKLKDGIRIVSASLLVLENGPGYNSHGHKLFLITGNLFGGEINA